jgi:2-amino-4-hydroxy-6-hydroxymethyldihydropteridine diphosphokinase
VTNGIYILLGTNVGDRSANLLKAKHLISRSLGSIVTESSVYKTSAWGNTNQPEFYNLVIELATTLTPHQVLTSLLSIEEEMGRVRNEKWGPRIIDLDILFWQDLVINDSNLIVPHPGIPNRKFTLMPLAELIPNYIHPEYKRTIAQMLQACSDALPVEKIIG